MKVKGSTEFIADTLTSLWNPLNKPSFEGRKVARLFEKHEHNKEDKSLSGTCFITTAASLKVS
jgi:hypothetical protein